MKISEYQLQIKIDNFLITKIQREILLLRLNYDAKPDYLIVGFKEFIILREIGDGYCVYENEVNTKDDKGMILMGLPVIIKDGATFEFGFKDWREAEKLTRGEKWWLK